MDRDFIILKKSFLDWEWYDDTNMVRLYLHLLLSANFERSRWHGRTIEIGQLITRIKKLSSETGISEWSVRTCLGRLVKSGEITIQPTNKFTIITVCNYNECLTPSVDTD